MTLEEKRKKIQSMQDFGVLNLKIERKKELQIKDIKKKIMLNVKLHGINGEKKIKNM